MALSILADAYKPTSRKSGKVPPHRRRATVDTASNVNRPSLVAHRMHRRLSLPAQHAVQFSDTSEVCVFDNSCSRSERSWYNGDDHRRFKQERVSDVASFREQSRRSMDVKSRAAAPASSSDGGESRSTNNPADETPPCCPVGIEQLLSTRSMYEAHTNRKVVIRSVLSEQRRQRSFGVTDPVMIATVSFQLSEVALEASVKRGRFQEMARYV